MRMIDTLMGGRVGMKRKVHRGKRNLLIYKFSENFLWVLIFHESWPPIKVPRETGLIQNVDSVVWDALNLFIQLKAFALYTCYFRIVMPDVSCAGCRQWNSSYIYLLIFIWERVFVLPDVIQNHFENQNSKWC